ncbi:SRPBCC family protein [Streptomyces sp. NPDC001922]|uniref:SRPBCC family protein n=1 Tax=Streptomyces sp. NPDC001922 TaxID=3364624 RepID=UPI003697EA6C
MNETLSTADGRPALRIERRLAHPPGKVWRALTEPEHLSRWYPFTATELDLRLGGLIRFDDGRGTVMDAVITELDPPRRFAFSQHAPEGMTRESDDLVRFELSPDGAGCVLVFTHVFDDRFAAASYASGWQVCLDALSAELDGVLPEPRRPSAESHDAYIERFGLDAGSAEETADGWQVRFERQLTRPAETVWALLTGGTGTDAPEPAVGGPVPRGFTAEGIPPGEVTAAERQAVLVYTWQSAGRTAGRVRWDLSPGTGHGARLVLTQTGPAEADTERGTALAAWRRRIAELAAQLRELP